MCIVYTLPLYSPFSYKSRDRRQQKWDDPSNKFLEIMTGCFYDWHPKGEWMNESPFSDENVGNLLKLRHQLGRIACDSFQHPSASGWVWRVTSRDRDGRSLLEFDSSQSTFLICRLFQSDVSWRRRVIKTQETQPFTTNTDLFRKRRNHAISIV